MVIHFEIPADDLERVKKFYSEERGISQSIAIQRIISWHLGRKRKGTIKELALLEV